VVDPWTANCGVLWCGAVWYGVMGLFCYFISYQRIGVSFFSIPSLAIARKELSSLIPHCRYLSTPIGKKKSYNKHPLSIQHSTSNQRYKITNHKQPDNQTRQTKIPPPQHSIMAGYSSALPNRQINPPSEQQPNAEKILSVHPLPSPIRPLSPPLGERMGDLMKKTRSKRSKKIS